MLALWSRVLAAGVSNELFWELTFDEVQSLCEAIGERERAANLRAGLITSAVYNVNRRPGTPAFQPDDFIREPLRIENFMDVDSASRIMDGWAAAINQGYIEVH